MTTSTTPMTAVELRTIERRLGSAGLFAAHAYTDVTRLLAEVHRLRRELAEHDTPRTPPGTTTTALGGAA